MQVELKKEMEDSASPSAEPWKNEEPAWYCVRTHLKHEHIAASHLKQLPNVGIFNPQLRLLRTTRQGRRWCTESLFPNYIFARFVLEAMFEKVTYTPGVKILLRFGDQPPEVPEAVIEDLRRDVEGLSSQVLTDSPAEGDEVEIAGGPFTGMKASVTRVLPGKQRAQILVEMMGQMTPAEINLGQVLFCRKDAVQFALPHVEPPPLRATSRPQVCHV